MHAETISQKGRYPGEPGDDKTDTCSNHSSVVKLPSMVHQQKGLSSFPILSRFHLLTIQPSHFHLYFLCGAFSIFKTVGDMVSSCTLKETKEDCKGDKIHACTRFGNLCAFKSPTCFSQLAARPATVFGSVLARGARHYSTVPLPLHLPNFLTPSSMTCNS